MKQYKTAVILLFLFLSFPLSAAIQGNRELAQLQEEVNQAILDVQDAKASRWPTVELELSGTYMSRPPIGPITVPAGVLGPNEILLYEGMESTAYDLGLTLTQPLFTWGKINASVHAQEAVANAKQQKLRNREKELTAEIATRAGTRSELEAIHQLLEQQYSLGDELVTLASKAVASGLMLELERSEIELQLQEIELALIESEYSTREQTLELNTLTKEQDLSVYDFQEDAIHTLLKKPIDALLEQALSSERASIRALFAMKRATEETEKLAKGSFYGKPDLALVVSAGYSGSRFPFVENDWQEKDASDFTVSVGLKTTIFDGGKISNTIKRSQSQGRTADMELQETRERITKEVKENHLLLRSTMQKIQLEQKKQATMQQRLSTNEALYQSGYGSKQDVIQAQMNLLTSQITEHRLRIEAWTAYQKLWYLCE
ncbi:MAG: TolC family protein [Sphaerochaetaceae bacterium]